ncbi:MAG: hypothetical protein PVJ15_02720 [Gammaproteobacteria bacterium]|jgi:hypothetical protein
MLTGRHHYRKPDPLWLLAVAVAFAVVMSTAVQAGEPSFQYFPEQSAYLSSVEEDGGLTVATMGRAGGDVHLSLYPPSDVIKGIRASGGSEADLEKFTNIFLTVRFPW